ncbi:5'-methylthioadenosine phosphorylase [Neisseria chenwenguii]|uniref:5'-methylthioadenosine phosphorylase n=1 Tax=Neisseria chenwenguii TaxID=1853278 RepID=A0A220RYU7_9NEIS|nr:S-methyl-5'-thioinosine phosphorylase [Neisseria chenwenguii]ASK26354.1 5'-methylthioadenosine phosphorylase [Neisseria chenwenguii]
MFAIIGGSGFAKLPELNITDRRIVRTPYGLTSSPLLFGRLGSLDIVFLARHGFGHTIAPHEINYRANIWALDSVGVTDITAVSAVTAANGSFENGALVMPHDLIDYTSSRSSTYFEGPESPVVHTDFTEPYSAVLRATLLEHAGSHNVPVYSQAVYGCLQGPRWPTRAEIRRYRNDGADVLGMTGMPEAFLARELGLNYAHFCAIVGTNCLSTGVQNNECTLELKQSLEKIRLLLAGL